jgi:hypothetical protein
VPQVSYLDEDKSMTLRQWVGLDPVESRPRLAWWRPPARDVIRQMTWRWALLLPVSLAVGLIVAAHVRSHDQTFLAYLGIKLLVITFLLPALMWDHFRQRAIRARTDPFCIHCGWTLRGLPQEGRCPECGQPYRMKVVEMYRRDPQWVRAYWQFDGRPPSMDAFNHAHPRCRIVEE